MELAVLLFILLVVLFWVFHNLGQKQRDYDHGWRSQTSQEPSQTPEFKPAHDAGSVKKALPQIKVKTATAQSNADVRKNIGNLPEVKVQHVIDGDTVMVANSWLPIKIRLDSIDCPEDGQPWGNIATAGLIKMIGGKHVRLEEHGQDVYGRTLATIYVFNIRTNDWMNVNERMVTLGHAWVMRSFYGHLPDDRKNNLNRLECWSKSKNVGLWGTQNPTPPWLWRKIAPAP